MTTEPESTTTRRDLLGILLSRVERGVITDQERPLLRPLVEAEMAEPDAVRAEARTEYEALMVRFNDLRTETLRQGKIHDDANWRSVELAATLREVLATFRHETHPGYSARQSEHVEAERVELWRAVLAHGRTCPDGEPCPVHDEVEPTPAAASVQDGEAGL